MIPRIKLHRQQTITQTNQDYLQFILRHSRTYIVVLNTAGTVIDVIETSCNPALPREEQLGRPLWKVGWWDSMPDGQERIQKEIAQAAQGIHVEGCGGFHTRTGEEHYGSYTFTPLLGEQGKVSLIVFEAFDITEQKRKEQEIQQIFDMSLDIICIMSLDDYYIKVNPAFEKILGYKPEEVIGHHTTEWAHPDDLPRVQRVIEGLRHGEPLDLFENRYRAKGGTYKWLAWSARPDLDKNVAYLVVRDITDQRCKEQEIQHLFEMSLDIICVVSLDGYYIRVNPAFERVLGYKQEEVVGHSVNEWVHPDDLESKLEKFASLRRGEHVDLAEKRYRAKDGTYKWLAWSARPDLDKNVAYVIARDITEQKHQKQEIQHIFDMSIDMLCIVGLDDRFIRVNPAFERTLGYTPDELIGRRAIELVHPDDMKETLANTQRMKQGEYIYNAVNRYLAKDGTYKWLAWSARPNLDENVAYVMVRDITEQKAREQLRDTFMGMASHELRTPLTGISTSLQMTRKRLKHLSLEDMKQFAEQVERIQKNIERAEQQVSAECRIINDIVDANRISQGHLEIHPAPIDLLYIVHQAIADIQNTNPERQFHFMGPTVSHIPVFVDAMRISQVLTNLLTNATKYSPNEQPIEIVVDVSQERVKVSVRDYGPGLNPEEQKRVWERFYQIPGRRVQGGAGGSMGLGLGLYICQTIISIHNGKIGVDSTPGEGATFWFTLPLNT